MTYITTQHKFIIDDQHPADVFAEMANFFSLYTVAIDSLQRMSIQLCVPTSFAINDNQKLHDGYQQFIKAVRYTISDINVLPVKTLESDASQNDMLTLMVQYYEGRIEANGNATINASDLAENNEPKPKFYQKILGGLLPKFANEKSFEGLYPEPVAPTLIMPEPVAVAPIVPTIPTPVPSVPRPVAQPIQAAVVPTPTMPQMPVPQPSSHPPMQAPAPVPHIPVPTQSATPSRSVLPKPSKSIQPYRQLLTQAIVAQIHAENLPNPQPLQKITFKSRDSLTTAFIETVFATFQANQPDNNALNKLGRAHDAIDLVSYGLEELRPQLSKLGVSLADDAQFLLNSKARARPEDIGMIQQGQLDPRQLNLGVQLDYTAINTIAPSPSMASPNVTRPISQNAIPQPSPSKPPTIEPNTNRFNIALTVTISDSLGERAVKLKHFPAIVTSDSHKSDPNSTLIKVLPQQGKGQFFTINEQDGQLVVQQISPNFTIYRNAQSLNNGDTLLPHDVITIGQAAQITLLPT